VGNPKRKALTKRCRYGIIYVSILDAGCCMLDSGAQKRDRFRPWASLRLLYSTFWLIFELTDQGRCVDST
jgi:hypothetical protein